jgi:hypothetical protein
MGSAAKIGSKYSLSTYDPRGPSFTKKIRKTQAVSKKILLTKYASELTRIEVATDSLYRRQACYMWLSHVALCHDCHTSSYRVGLTAFHKGLISIASAVELARSGLTAASYSAIRYGFEAVVTAKYCLQNGASLADRWSEGQSIYFTNAVLKKIPSKNSLALKEYWNELSLVAHFTLFSGQISVPNDEGEPTKGPIIESTLVHVERLLHMFAHLQRSELVTKSMQYYNKRYASDLAKIDAREQIRLKKTLKDSLQSFLHEDRKLIQAFSQTWK